jgi:hypothetical protein
MPGAFSELMARRIFKKGNETDYLQAAIYRLKRRNGSSDR